MANSITPTADFTTPASSLIPADCAAVMDEQILTAGADNWCRRALPSVIDIFWFTSPEGHVVNWDPIEDDPPTLMDHCNDEPTGGSGGGTGPGVGSPGGGGPVGGGPGPGGPGGGPPGGPGGP